MKISKSELSALIEEVMNEAKSRGPSRAVDSTQRPQGILKKPVHSVSRHAYPTKESAAEKAWRDFLKVLRKNKMSFSKGKIKDAKSGELLVAVDKIR